MIILASATTGEQTSFFVMVMQKSVEAPPDTNGDGIPDGIGPWELGQVWRQNKTTPYGPKAKYQFEVL